MSLVEDVLTTWMDAEQLLDDLPAIDPDHETVRLAVTSLRATYRDLTTGPAMTTTPQVLLASQETIEGARLVLAAIRAKQRSRTT